MITSQLILILDAQCLHIEIGKAFSRHIVPFVTSKGGRAEFLWNSKPLGLRCKSVDAVNITTLETTILRILGVPNSSSFSSGT